MGSVWLVVGSEGEWGDYREWVDSVWDSEPGAVSHIVRGLGCGLDVEGARRGMVSWTDGDDDFPVSYGVERRELRHGWVE